MEKKKENLYVIKFYNNERYLFSKYISNQNKKYDISEFLKLKKFSIKKFTFEPFKNKKNLSIDKLNEKELSLVKSKIDSALNKDNYYLNINENIKNDIEESDKSEESEESDVEDETIDYEELSYYCDEDYLNSKINYNEIVCGLFLDMAEQTNEMLIKGDDNTCVYDMIKNIDVSVEKLYDNIFKKIFDMYKIQYKNLNNITYEISSKMAKNLSKDILINCLFYEIEKIITYNIPLIPDIVNKIFIIKNIPTFDIDSSASPEIISKLLYKRSEQLSLRIAHKIFEYAQIELINGICKKNPLYSKCNIDQTCLFCCFILRANMKMDSKKFSDVKYKIISKLTPIVKINLDSCIFPKIYVKLLMNSKKF